MAGVLNLQKNDILDLTKKNPGLKKVRLGAGWDIANNGLDYDLDIAAFLLDANNKFNTVSNVIFFNNKIGQGISLAGDNRTGAGDGDDEKISVDLEKLPANCSKVVFALNIYNAVKRKQSFSKVKNAYIRLLNEDNGDKEICRYNLSEDGGDNTALLFAELERNNGSWQFKAKGELLHATVSSLANMYK